MSVTITDVDGETYTADNILLDNGKPLFRRGSELQLSLEFNTTTVYTALLDKFNVYLTPDTIKYKPTTTGLAKYKQNINPLNSTTSYLWKFTTTYDSLDDWWVILVDITDNTQIVGASNLLQVTVVPIAPTSEGDRNYIIDTYEVQ